MPDKNTVLRLEVELRDKNARRRPNYRHKNSPAADRNPFTGGGGGGAAIGKQMPQHHPATPNPNNYFVPMEKVSGTAVNPKYIPRTKQ